MPPSNPSAAPPDLRQRLVTAAMEILGEDTPLDLRKVAERAGKSRTAPYLVFGKESEGGGLLALRMAVAAEGARVLADEVEAARRAGEASSGDGPIEAMERVAERFLRYARDNPRLFALIFGAGLDQGGEFEAEHAIESGLRGPSGPMHHPEFLNLALAREQVAMVLRRVIQEGQEVGLLPADRRGSGNRRDALEGSVTPSHRFFQIAWVALIGVATLRKDPVLRALDMNPSPESGARLVVEAVFGIDAGRVRGAAEPFLRSARSPHPPEYGSWASAEGPPAPASRGESPTPSVSTLVRSYSGLRRAARAEQELREARILWIDDHPRSVQNEVETLKQLGAAVEVVDSTEKALEVLRARLHPDGPGSGAATSLHAPEHRPRDLIISDIARGSVADEGIRALKHLRTVAPAVPVVFFVGQVDPYRPAPAGSAGLTNDSDELLHLVLDLLDGRPG